MSWRRLRTVIRRSLFLPTDANRDLDDEIRFHLAEEERLQAERGLSPDDATAAARRAFGSVTCAKEDTRAVWVSVALEQLLQDLRFGCRILTRSPAVSATAVILIAVVIGGNTTVFSIAHGILTKPSPGVHASRLTTVSWVNEQGDVWTHTSYPVYSHFLEHSATLRPIAAFDFLRVTLATRDGSYAVRAGMVSPNYFETLGVRLVKGRSFTVPEAERDVSGLVVVISHNVWQNYFAGIDDIIGQPLSVNGRPATIVGVAEPDFRGAIFVEQADLWLPSHGGQGREWLQPNRSTVEVMMIGRLAPSASMSEAFAELTTLWTQLQRAYPELNQKFKPTLVPYSGTAGGNSIVATRGNQMLAIFSIVTLLTVAIVCANVTNLLIARAVVRQREMALRQSLGASRVRIVRSLLAEGLVLSVAAWIAACLFAWWVAKLVVAFVVPASQGPAVMPDLTPDWVVVGYALMLAVFCTIAVTLGPAWRTWRQQLLPFLKVGEQGVVPARSKLSRGLVVVQLAFSVLLLTIAGLAHRSLALEDSLDVGFETKTIVLATVNTAGAADGPQTNGALVEALSARLARLPGVDATSYVPGSRMGRWAVDFEVRRDRSADPVMAVDKRVAPGFFATLDVPFIAGRDFLPDGGKEGQSAIVTRELAAILWPGESPVGKVLLAGPLDRAVEMKVVGVVQDAYFAGRGRDNRSRYIFFSAAERQTSPGETTFYVRHSGRHATTAPAIVKALREADARVPIANLRSLEDEILSEVSPLWTLTILLTIFAGGSLLIAAIGQYAVVAFDGRRRTREFGLRIALGASPQRLVGAVIAENLRLTGLGLVIGFALSAAVATVLARLLYGVTATDPPTYIGVFVLLAAASLLACYLPARRAARTDPILALRTE